MDELKLYLAMLLVYRHNFHMLHWCAAGEKFNRIHDNASKYYEEILGTADEVAEYAMRLGIKPPSFPECFTLLKESDATDFLIVGSDEVDYHTFLEQSEKMFHDICKGAEILLATDTIQEPENVGIKSGIEAIHNEYDLYLRYLNKRPQM